MSELEREYNLDSDEENQFIIFALNDIYYGTPLLGVREIIKWQECKEVPNTKSFFLGVINLRGQVVGVIDLKMKFGMKEETSYPDQRLVVFDTINGPLSIKVDEVISVSSLDPDTIDKNPPVASEVPSDYLIGIGKHNDDLINLVDLNQVLSREELANSFDY